jgi:hypothetical protein
VARRMSAAAMAKHLRRWAEVGIDGALVIGAVNALRDDRRDSQARAPKKTGRLAATVRVVRPTVARTKRTGMIRASLAAGSRSGGSRAVAYASVLQTGKVGYPAQEKTRAHRIEPRRGTYAGDTFRTTGVLSFENGGTRVFAKSVKHPGTRFPALGYLKVDEARMVTSLDRAVERSFEFPMAPTGGGTE